MTQDREVRSELEERMSALGQRWEISSCHEEAVRWRGLCGNAGIDPHC